MDEALTRIALISDGGVMRLTARITGSQTLDHAPSSDLAATIDQLAERYMACRTHRRRLAVILDAQITGDLLRYAPRSEQRGTREWKEAIGTDQRSCRAVASVYKVSLRDVVAYRKAHRA